ncbi:MAG: hypothetical protein ACREUL_10065 [Steroidobacteraceae bacterium]
MPSHEYSRQCEPAFSSGWVRPSEPADGPAILALLWKVGLQPQATPEYLHWKYWQERADWPGSRSYVLTDGRELLAHVGVVPVCSVSQSGRVRMASMVDWAADPRQVGAGVRVMKHVATLTDALLAIGASTIARRVMPHMGYQPHGFVTSFVRPFSLTRSLREATDPSWKRVPRLARRAFWTLTAPRAVNDGWQAHPLLRSELRRIDSVLPEGRGGLSVSERSACQLNYMLDCPAARMQVYALEQESRLRGYFVLAFVPGQARLVDAWVASEAESDWRSMVQCAVREAKREEEVAEVAAWASDPVLSNVLQRAGFHPRWTTPILVRAADLERLPKMPLRVHMLDSDVAHLHDGRRTLWS